MSEGIRVLLADDHALAREGLRRLLELEQDLEVVGEAANGEEVMTKVRTLSPDVILMDIKLPKIDGLGASRLLKTRRWGGKVIVLSFYEEYLVQALEAGVEGYLTKDLGRDELVDAVRRVHQGELVLGSSLRSNKAAQIIIERLKEITEEPSSSDAKINAEVVLPPSIGSSHLLAFSNRLQRELDAEILETVGGSKSGTLIRFRVAGSVPLPDALLKLSEVEDAWEEPVRSDTTGFPSTNRQDKMNLGVYLRFRISLKEPSEAEQLILPL